MNKSCDFLGEKVWPLLTKVVKRQNRHSYVAVAYFGRKAERWLPLSKGSVLVVDTSDGAVKSGQTCPESTGGPRHPNVSIIFVEVPRASEVEISKMVRKIGRGSRSKLYRGRIIRDQEFIDEVYQAFKIFN